jgi:uncharacterized protein YidB (DUF937 family)
MGLLDMLQNLGGQGGATPEQHTGIANALLEHVGSHPGGLSGLLQGFHNAGLGEQTNSWVSTGQNQQVSPDQVEQGLGSGPLNQIASRAGVSPTVAKIALAAVLPMIVDHLTPGGNVPHQSALAGMIGRLMGRAA